MAPHIQKMVEQCSYKHEFNKIPVHCFTQEGIEILIRSIAWETIGLAMSSGSDIYDCSANIRKALQDYFGVKQEKV